MVSEWLTGLNESAMFYGIIIVICNLGAKYIQADLHEGLDEIGYHPVVRKLLIFGIIYAGIRDLSTSFLILLVYMIVRKFLSKGDDSLSLKVKKGGNPHNGILFQ